MDPTEDNKPSSQNLPDRSTQKLALETGNIKSKENKSTNNVGKHRATDFYKINTWERGPEELKYSHQALKVDQANIDHREDTEIQMSTHRKQSLK